MGLKEIALKTITYPILGNTSSDLQKLLEEKTDWYKGLSAECVSEWTNFVPYVVLPFWLTKDVYMGDPPFESPLAPSLFFATMGYWIVEGLVRTSLHNHERSIPSDDDPYSGHCEYWKYPAASLPGKILSIPFDILNNHYTWII